MGTTLEVLFTPAEFSLLSARDLSQTVCVVFDILRATTSLLTALGNGAEEIIPVAEISEALAIRARQPGVLLAGEREGLRIRAALTGGVDFEFGNSPREFTPEKVRGKKIVITTTNGTRALRACSGAKQILVGAFLNLRAVANWLEQARPPQLLLICSGTFDQAAYEDVLAAGALCDLIWASYERGQVSDAAQIARHVYRFAHGDLLGAIQSARNGRRLLAHPELADDVRFCAQRDTLQFVAVMRDHSIQRLRP